MIAQDSFSTLNKLQRMLGEQLDQPATAMRPERSIINHLGSDTVDLLDLSIRIADEFGVEMYLEDMPATYTVGKLAAAIEFLCRERRAHTMPVPA